MPSCRAARRSGSARAARTPAKRRGGVPPGHLLTRAGPISAGEDDFAIHIRGRGGHASAPHLLIDPLVTAAEVITALQQVVARNVDPVATAVHSCTDLRTDGARNAIPSNVHSTGDARSFDPAVQALLERRIRDVSTGIAAAHGATAPGTCPPASPSSATAPSPGRAAPHCTATTTSSTTTS